MAYKQIMDRFQTPEFSVNPKAEDWDFFYRQFQNYLLIVKATEDQKLPLFLNCLRRDGLLLFDGLLEPKTSYSNAVAWFQAHFAGHMFILLKRKQFYEARQAQSETVTSLRFT